MSAIQIGYRVGRLTVEEPTAEKKAGYTVWKCRCDCGGEILLGELAECLPGSPDPQKQMEDREIAGHISRFLRGLPQESRRIFLLRYWYGSSVAEIAGACGCGAGKVKSALFRTRKALRAYLEREGVVL